MSQTMFRNGRTNFKKTLFNWNEIYNMPYNASIGTTFQYKLINRIIPKKHLTQM